MVKNHTVWFLPTSTHARGPPTGWVSLATPLPCAIGKRDPKGSHGICEQSTIGHGREPTVFWGTTGARGGRLAGKRDVKQP